MSYSVLGVRFYAQAYCNIPASADYDKIKNALKYKAGGGGGGGGV